MAKYRIKITEDNGKFGTLEYTEDYPSYEAAQRRIKKLNSKNGRIKANEKIEII